MSDQLETCEICTTEHPAGGACPNCEAWARIRDKWKARWRASPKPWHKKVNETAGPEPVRQPHANE
jgi:hypothetical protein